jgi:4-oxalocrotonate tautomerase family enzyme
LYSFFNLKGVAKMPIITIQFIQEVVATPEQKRRLVIELTDKFVEILGDVVRPFVYCIIQETPQGEWAIAGVPMPDLVYLTGEQHARVIGRSNDLMRAAVAQASGVNSAAAAAAERADAVWRGVQSPSRGGDADVLRHNKWAVARFHSAIGTFDRAVFHELLHPQFINHPNLTTVQVGPQALIDGLAPFHAALSNLTVTENYVLAQRNRVATRITTTGRHTGSFMGIPPSGRMIQFTGLVIYRFDDDGQIIERWQDFDSAGMMQQLTAAG